ncbi:MAG: thiol reductant ABC exporter subunit CydD [Pseudonocardia sp.]
MKPLDPRLLRHAAAARRYVALAAGVAVAAAVLLIVQAELLARLLDTVFHGWVADGGGGGGVPDPPGGTVDGTVGGAGGLVDGTAAVTGLGWLLAGLAVVVLARAGLSWAGEVAAHRAAADVVRQLRAALVTHVLRLGPRHPDLPPGGELANLATRGLDGLDGYFGRYLPTLLVAAVVPLTIGGWILLADGWSALIIGLTVPLIPIFMILIGLHTERATSRQWRALATLGHHFLDLVAGLDVLVAFGRARRQSGRMRELADAYRRTTMRTLRVAFLSALALELLATLSVALVAVSVGLRLVEGRMDLATALLVLILAPEVYLPLRAVGARFHDSAEGLAAAAECFAVLELPDRQTRGYRRTPAPDPSRVPVRVEAVGVRGRSGPILDGFSMTLQPGEVVGLRGPSGAGKSTLVDLLLDLRAPDEGRITVGGVDLAVIDRAAWLRRVAWVPQRPVLVAGTVAANIRLALPSASDGEVAAAGAAAALDVDLDTRVGEDGAGLSTGQRRRVALARAVLADRPLLLLDEPTEGVDAATEAAIACALPQIAAGRTVLVVSHRATPLAACDRVVTLPGPVPATPAADAGRTAAAAAAGPGAAADAGPGATATDAGPGTATADAGPGAAAGPGPGASAAVADSAPLDPGAPPAAAARTTADPADPAHPAAIPLPRRDHTRFAGAAAPAKRLHALRGGETADLAEAAGPARGIQTLRGGGTAEAAPAGSDTAWAALRWSLGTARAQRGRLLLAALLGAAALGSGVALAGTSAWLIATAALHPPVLTLMVAIVAVRTFGLSRGVLRYAERLVAHDAALRAGAVLRERIWTALVRLGPADTARMRRGDLLARLVGDVDTQQDLLLRSLLPAAAAGLVGLGTAAALTLVLPAAGLAVAAGTLIAAVVAPAVTAWAAHRTERETAAARGDVVGRTVALLDGAADLVVFGAATRHREELGFADARLGALLRRAATARGLGAGIAVAGVGLAVLGATAAGIAALRAGTISGPALVVLALTPLALADVVATLPDAAVRLLTALPAARRLRALERREPAVTEPAAPAGIAPPTELATEDLAVRWPGAAADAVRDVDLDLHRGTRLALTGPSGSGKSTVVAALMRSLDPSAGVVLADGHDARDLTGDELRAGIAWCGPWTHLFDSTLRENLRLARPDASDAELVDVLHRARLGEWHASLPEGLDTPIGMHGGAVSGGERQRLGVARALLADRPVLLLDEPTAHLDSATGDALAAELLATTEGRTALLVTHRPEQTPGLPELRLGAPAATREPVPR